MNKKIISLLIAGAMLSSAAAAFAADTEINPISAVSAEQTAEDKAAVNQYIGTVKSVDKNIVTVAVEAEDGEYEAAFWVTDSTPVYDINGNEADEVKAGDKVIVLSTAGLLTKDIKPVSALIINNEDIPGSVYYDTFSKSEMGFISSDGELVLNIEDELEDEYDGKTLLVFYNIMTLSIPAQTNPTQIVVLDDEEDEPAEETENEAQAVKQYSGIVESYEKNLLTVKIDGESVTFATEENTPVYDLQSQEKSEIKEGDAVYVFSTSSLFTKDIKPAKAVVTGAADDITVSVKLDSFNDSEWGLVSSDNKLVINVEDKEEYEGKELLVFYDITTRSIPAQTNPLAVIVLDEDKKKEENKKVSIFFKVGDCILSINGQDIEVEKPYIAGEGVTLVPLRVISEAFGAAVDWDGDTKTVSIGYGDKTLTLQINNKSASVNDEENTLEEAPQLTENGFTMVPLRFISEAFGADVSYDEETKGITVELNK
ncbi:MAG: copper amine oxidase N-terminal domain-containing protein [Candidatus Ornithomonoglobus sp.]